MKTLDNIVNEAYNVFSGNKPGEYLDACTHCCMKESNAELLKSIPLRQIPIELLKEYQDAAKPVKLDLSELKYFAPKYLEFLSKQEYLSYEPLLTLDRFGYFDRAAWTKEERQLLDDFSILFFREYLNTKNHENFTTPIEILLMFYKGKFDIQPLLDEWEKCTSNESLLHFNQLLDEINFNQHREPKVSNAFSDETFSELICSWLFARKIREKFKNQIEQALLEPVESLSDSDKENLSWKYEIIK